MKVRDRVLRELEAKVARLVGKYRRLALADPGGRETLETYRALGAAVASMRRLRSMP